MQRKVSDIKNEITLLVNSLNQLFDQLQAHQAKIKLLEARWWAHVAMEKEDIGIGGTE